MFSVPLSTMTGGLSRTRAAASADIGPLTTKRPIAHASWPPTSNPRDAERPVGQVLVASPRARSRFEGRVTVFVWPRRTRRATPHSSGS